MAPYHGGHTHHGRVSGANSDGREKLLHYFKREGVVPYILQNHLSGLKVSCVAVAIVQWAIVSLHWGAGSVSGRKKSQRGNQQNRPTGCDL